MVVGGLVVVVVGGLVVVVVVTAGPVVGVVIAPPVPAELDPPSAIVVVVVEVVLVVGDAVVPGDGCTVVGSGEGAGALAPADPGCSLATVTQMNAVAPPATTIAVLVRRLMRACARARATGEFVSRPCLMADREKGVRALGRDRPRGPRRATAYGPNLKNR